MKLKGKSAAPGAALGSIFIYNEKFYTPKESFIPLGQEQSQLEQYLKVKELVIEELEDIKLKFEKIDPEKALIFDAHKEIADDIIMNEEIHSRILKDRMSGDWAIYHVYETVMAVLRSTPDPLIAERVVDFDDVRSRLLRLWYGKKNEGLSGLKEPVIIAAGNLKPSDTVLMDTEKVLAILSETGGETSHAAIIAKSYGIPAVLGIKGLLDIVKQGQKAAIDAGEGTVILDPDEDTVIEYQNKIEEIKKEKEDARIYLDKEGRTSDGVKIDIGLNISGVLEDELNVQNYCDSAGLFRTEFLFMARSAAPSEEEQFETYRKALICFGGKPVILRTLDIGADKQIPYLNLTREENPFLGNRGLRFCLNAPELFKIQLRAALRASVFGNLWLMLPMVASISDIHRAKAIIAEVKESLKKDNIKYNDVKTGIMIEVPAIALIADKAAKEVDFASIGSNDLCQYMCAADRMNATVESYYQSYHPAMFRIIQKTASAFSIEKKPLSICGELGSDLPALPALIGLGIRKLSMGFSYVASVKRLLASITIEEAQETAEKVLQLSTACEIENFLKNR